jgi:type I restriction enzyme R subunit
MIERMGENDNIVTRYMADRDFQAAAYPLLAREIFDAVRAQEADLLDSFLSTTNE